MSQSNQNFKSAPIKEQVVHGSVKNKIVAPELIEERAKCAFDQQELKIMMMGGKDYYQNKLYLHTLFSSYPETRNHYKFYEMSLHE